MSPGASDVGFGAEVAVRARGELEVEAWACCATDESKPDASGLADGVEEPETGGVGYAEP